MAAELAASPRVALRLRAARPPCYGHWPTPNGLCAETTMAERWWEVYEHPGGTQLTCTQADNVSELRAKGLLGREAKRLHRFAAATHELAMTKFHELMGWEPYKPIGSPAPCPNGCGATY